MALTEKRISKLKGRGRYRDGNGLLLQITKSGSKSWVFRYERGGKERMMGLGPTHVFNLAQARKAARSARELLFLGVDPIESRLIARDSKRAEERNRITFKEATARYLDLHNDTWKNGKHRAQWQSTLERYAFPCLGARPVCAIDPALVNEALAPIWSRIPETASRVRHRINKVITWVSEGQPLPAKLAKRKAKNHAALPYAEVPTFMAELRSHRGLSARALEFLILNAARTGEVIGAVWDEFDTTAGIWTIPAERMKAGREHRVPLSDRALDLIMGLPREDGNPFVFIGAHRGKGLSNMSMLELMRALRPDYVPHGFRSSFKDWAADSTNFPNIVSEQALAHTVGGVEGAYRRSDLMDKRRRLMSAWAKYCSTCTHSVANVVPLKFVAVRA